MFFGKRDLSDNYTNGSKIDCKRKEKAGTEKPGLDLYVRFEY